MESTARSRGALSATAARVLGLDAPSDWTASGATLGGGGSHIQGTGSLAVSNVTSATITSRALSTLGANEIGSIIGFDIQIPEFQPNPDYFGAVQLYIDLPSRGIYNVLVGQKELTYLPRSSFRRVELLLSSTLQNALRATYSDLRLRFQLNTPGGTGPYLLDRISFAHEESEPIDNSRNIDILGFEKPAAWLASAGTTAPSTDRTEKKKSLSVTPSGWTVITSDRLATPSDPDDLIGFDLKMPRVGENPGWLGETQLYVELPSQGIFNAYVGGKDLAELRPDAFNRVSFTLPASIVSKLAEHFDDLRFRIVLNTPTGSGPFLLDRFRFGSVKEPTETVELPLLIPRNLGPSGILLLATDALALGAGVRIDAGVNPLLAVAALGPGGVSLGAGSEVDSVVSYGPVSIGENARVRGYISGAEELDSDASALIWGEVTAERAPLETSTMFVSFQPTTTDIFIDGESSTVLAPGRYRNVSVEGGVLRLEPGQYAFDRLTVAPTGSVEYDSRDGLPFVAVRTAMQLRGTTTDRTIEAGREPFGAPTWAYMGRDALDFSGAPPGRVIAPEADVRVTVPPSGSDTPTLWGVTGRRIAVVVGAGGSGKLRPSLPSHSPLPPFPRERAVSLSVSGASPVDLEQGSLEEPLLVFEDNPWWHGSFAWEPEESASGGCPPWFNGGVWDGVGEQIAFTLWRMRTGGPAQAWTAPLLPGYFFSPSGLAPDTSGSTACGQTPETWPRAFFNTRGYNLWRGATFRVQPSIPGARLTLPSAFVRIRDDVLVVPVVVIHWDGESFLEPVRAMFDFIPSREFSPDILPPVRPPSGPYTGPAQVDFPPDEIWKQCGIQFQIVRVLHLGRPDPLPFSASDGHCVPQLGPVCSCNNDPVLGTAMPDYVENEELSRRLHDAFGSEFDAIFGPEGLRPVLVQYGRPHAGSCVDRGYEGKAAGPSLVSTLADVHIGGLVQISESGSGVTTAHELGHVFLGSGHPDPDPDHLMVDTPSPRSKTITPLQCEGAKGVARGLSASYDRYNQRFGRTDGLSIPQPGTKFPGAVGSGSVSREIPMVCCDVGGGQKIETLAGLCIPPRGNRATDCNVCCKTGNAFEVVDNDACDPGDSDVLPAQDCTLVCCELGDHEEPSVPAGECAARGGETCVRVCCQIGSEPPAYLNRGECERGDGIALDDLECAIVP